MQEALPSKYHAEVVVTHGDVDGRYSEWTMLVKVFDEKGALVGLVGFTLDEAEIIGHLGLKYPKNSVREVMQVAEAEVYRYLRQGSLKIH